MKAGNQTGIAILEFSALLLLLLPLFWVTLAYIDYASETNTVNFITDRALHDLEVQPLEVDIEGGYSVTVREPEIQQEIETALNRAALEIQQTAWELDEPSESFYRIEGAYSILAIDEVSGQSQGFVGAPVAFLTSRGSYFPPASVSNELSFTERFASLEGLSNESGEHVYALFTPSFGGGESEEKYFPFVVLVAIRAFVKRDQGTFSYWFDDSDEGIIKDLKVSVLRGGVAS